MNIFLIILAKIRNKFAVRTIEVTFVIHETENTDKLLSCICDTLGLLDTDFVLKSTDGHHGNTIKFVQAYFVRNRVPELTKKILSSLSIVDRNYIITHVTDYLDNKFTFYLRFSKQDIMDKCLKVSYNGSIRIKMKPKIKLHKNIVLNSYEDLLRDYS